MHLHLHVLLLLLFSLLLFEDLLLSSSSYRRRLHEVRRIPFADAHRLACLKYLGNFRIEVDHHRLALLDLVVALIHPLLDPIVESLPDDGVDHVPLIGPRQLLDLLLDRQEVEDFAMAQSKFEDALHFEPLILGNGNDLDLVVLDNPLFPRR